MEINKILVPVDFSECSTNALRFAIKLRDYTNASIKIIHGYKVPIPAAEITIQYEMDSIEQYRQSADEKMEILRLSIPELNNIDYQYQLVTAFAKDAILSVVEKDTIDLIIMGTKGITNDLDALLGSNAYGIIKEADCPVLTIPQDSHFQPFKDIVFATDYKGIDGIEKLEFLKVFGKLFNATIHILHVSDMKKEIENVDKHGAINLNRYLHDINHTFAFSGEENVELGINKYIEEHNVNLVVLYPRKHKFFNRLFKKSVTKTVAHHTTLPLLTIHE